MFDSDKHMRLVILAVLVALATAMPGGDGQKPLSEKVTDLEGQFARVEVQLERLREAWRGFETVVNELSGRDTPMGVTFDHTDQAWRARFSHTTTMLTAVLTEHEEQRSTLDRIARALVGSEGERFNTPPRGNNSEITSPVLGARASSRRRDIPGLSPLLQVEVLSPEIERPVRPEIERPVRRRLETGIVRAEAAGAQERRLTLADRTLSTCNASLQIGYNAGGVNWSDDDETMGS